MTTHERNGEVVQLSILAAASRLRSGSLRAIDLLEAYLDRIAEHNGGEPSFEGDPGAVNAWVRIYAEEAREAARWADARLQRDADSAPLLCGIPIALKDLFAVGGRPLTASSRILEGNLAAQDSAVWARLAASWPVRVYPTHLHVVSAVGSTDQVCNPLNLAHSPGGSSGWAGAALAASMVAAAVGTDTAGSVRIPAALCGVSGFKPSYGRVPLEGVIPLAPSLDHVGPLARSLQDCAVVLASLTRASQPTNPLLPHPPVALPVGRPLDGPRPLTGIRVALTNRAHDIDLGPDIAEGLRRAREVCQDLGATIVELTAPEGPSRADYDTILLSEMRGYHRRYASQAERYRPSTREFLNLEAEGELAWDYITAQQRRIEATTTWQQWFVDNAVDVLLEPSSAAVAPERGRGYEAGRAIGGTDPFTAFTATWNATGFPVASIPTQVGDKTGLPVGVSIVGRLGADLEAMQVGLTLEAAGLPPLELPPSPVGG